MLLVGSDDGVYRVTGVLESAASDVQKVLRSDRVLRVRTFDEIDGAFAATKSGLYHTFDGDEWTTLDVPREQVYAVGASPNGDRIYAGTRPAHVYVARPNDAESLEGGLAWRELDGFHELSSRDRWGIARHDNLAQVRDLRVPDGTPDRVVAGIEVGGVYVGEDGGETWTSRSVDGFDAPHTDDIHHLSVEDGETVTAATGSGLYRTTDAGRSWKRLDADFRQGYFRETFVRDGVLFAGGSPTSPSSWEEDSDHALFECHDGRTLERVSSPTPDEVAVGWCAIDDDLVATTHRGTLLHRHSGGWRESGSIPVPESVHGRCVPLSWYEP